MSIDNVIRPHTTLPRGARGDFPAMYWKEDGESYIANNENEILPGSTPYHPSNATDKAPPAAKPAPAFSLTKQEVVKHLMAGGVKHKATQSHAALHDLLLTSVKNALTEADIAFDPESTDAAALLELFPKD